MWVKVDDQLRDHPKIVAAGPLASWQYVCGLTYCGQYLTDGFIPRGQIRKLADVDNAFELAAKLVEVGLWEEVEGGYQVHDWHKYNPPASKVKQEREENAKRQADWRERNRVDNGQFVGGVSNTVTNTVTSTAVIPAPSPSPSPSPSPFPVPIPHNADSPNGESDALKRVERKPVQDVVREAQLELNQPGTNKCAIVHRVACTLYGRSPDYGYIGTAATRVGGYGVLVDLLAANVNKANGCPVSYAEQVWKNRNRSNGGRAGPTRLEPHTLRSNVKCAKCKQPMREYVYETRDKRIPWCYECDGEGPIDDKPG